MAAAAEVRDDQTLVDIVEASDLPLDITRYVNFVRDPAAGAIATFEGATRDTFEGRRVVELRYEAYVSMAARRIGSILSAARATWSLLRLAAAHRLGVVPVGEASVFVAVSAVHRSDALEACRYVIDELKASVPIWKKEVYDNGEVWKENSEFFHRRAEGSNPMPLADPVPAPVKVSRCCGSKVKVGDNNGVGKEGKGLPEKEVD